MRRFVILLHQCCQCYLCPDSINKYALQRDTHSVDDINTLRTNHHLWFQQQTHTHTKMFDSVDITLHRHRHEWRPVQVVRRGFALTDVVKLKYLERPHAGRTVKSLTHTDGFALQSARERRETSFWIESRCGACLSHFCH